MVQERGRNKSLEKIVQGEGPGPPFYLGFTIIPRTGGRARARVSFLSRLHDHTKSDVQIR